MFSSFLFSSRKYKIDSTGTKQASSTVNTDAISADTEVKLKQVEEAVQQNKDAVIANLLDAVIKVDAHIHPNAALQLNHAA